MSDQDLAKGNYSAAAEEGVQRGFVVYLQELENGNSRIVYAGPIATAPSPEGSIVVLSPDDFALLQSHNKRHQH